MDITGIITNAPGGIFENDNIKISFKNTELFNSFQQTGELTMESYIGGDMNVNNIQVNENSALFENDNIKILFKNMGLVKSIIGSQIVASWEIMPSPANNDTLSKKFNVNPVMTLEKDILSVEIITDADTESIETCVYLYHNGIVNEKVMYSGVFCEKYEWTLQTSGNYSINVYIHKKGTPNETAAIYTPKSHVEYKENVLLELILYSLPDYEFVKRVSKRIENIPDSNGSKYYRKIPLKIGVVCDELRWNCWKDAADFIYIPPADWKKKISETDLFLFAASFRGLNKNDWLALNEKSSNSGKIIFDIFKYCKEKNIPSVFYSGDDPLSYADFINYAKCADYIFTSCAEKIPEYKSDCGHDNVFYLPLVFNPLYHNAIGSLHGDYEPGVVFAGSWRGNYLGREKNMETLFDGVIDSDAGLKIFDRNFSLKNQNNFYPDKYYAYICPEIQNKTLQKVYKLFRFALSVNTVSDSETMLAPRVPELQAAGSIVMSNYSFGIASLFPNIKTYLHPEDISADLNTMTDYDILDLRMAGIRRAYKNHSSFDVIGNMLKTCGFTVNSFTNDNILVVSDFINKNIREMFESQSHTEKTLVSAEDFPKTDISKFVAVAFWKSGRKYSQYYLEDMFNGFKYTNCDYITKDACCKSGDITDGVSHNYVSRMPDKYRTMFWRKSFSKKILENMGLSLELPNGYSIDPLNLDISPVSVKKPAKKKKQNYQLTVVIPVYNNGLFLKYRCFASLKRSSIWNEIKILLIDNGSDDNETTEIIKELAENHSNNTEAYFFPQDKNADGDVSRAKNKGLELADTPYITFLNPYSEAIQDGYAKLCVKMESAGDCDFAVGKSDMLSAKQYETQPRKTFEKIGVIGYDDITSPIDDLLALSDFETQNMQAVIIKTDFCKQNNISFINGACDEDTLFYYKMLLFADRIICVDFPVVMQYFTPDYRKSTPNSKIFKSLSALGIHTIDFLAENGYVESYITNNSADKLFDLLREFDFFKIKNIAELKEISGFLLEYIEAIISSGYETDRRMLLFYDALKREAWHDIPAKTSSIYSDAISDLFIDIKNIAFTPKDKFFVLSSKLEKDDVLNVKATAVLPYEDLECFDNLGMGAWFNATGSLDIYVSIDFINEDDESIETIIAKKRTVCYFKVPQGTNHAEISFVLKGAGEVTIYGLHITSRELLEESAKFAPKYSATGELIYNTKLNRLANDDFLPEILPKLENFPQSNGSRIYKKRPVRIAIICNQEFYDSYNIAADLIYISAKNPVIPENTDAFIIAATHRGIDKTWEQLKDESEEAKKIYKLIQEAKGRNIPTAYIGKDDPDDYSLFTHIAKNCGYIFTTASECIERYKKLCGHDRVYKTTGSFNPIICNPIGSMSEFCEKRAIFADSWHSEAEIILNGVISADVPLHIIDNYHGRKAAKFPEKYMRYMSPYADYDALQKIHRLFPYAINANLYGNSETTFAAQILELQALGNFIISDYSTAVERLFPNIRIHENIYTVAEDLTGLTEEEILRIRMDGVRRVMPEYTSFDVLDNILYKMGAIDSLRAEKIIAVVASGNTEKIKIDFENQSYPHKILINSLDFKRGKSLPHYDAIAFFDDKYVYGGNYLEDMMNAFRYTACDYVIKDSYFDGEKYTDGVKHGYVDFMPEKYRALFWAENFDRKSLLDLEGTVILKNGYSIDPFELEIRDE